MRAYRGALLHFTGDPDRAGSNVDYHDDGLLLVDQGRVVKTGPTAALLPTLPEGIELTHFEDRLILPGFIDTHIHYAQTGIIASHGHQLLDWLNQYTFPFEARFADAPFAAAEAEFFLDQLLSNGTTTALVFGTVHKVSAEAFFQAAERRGLRMIAGKVMMDRNAPKYLCDTPKSAYEDSRALIERWHGRGRLRYAVTPRFAPTSSREQLAAAGRLLREYPDVYLHTHLSENKDEIAWVSELFPDAAHYVDAYDRFGLVGQRSVFAHGIHLCAEERQRLAQAGSAIAFCPTSNLFIGSGLFDLAAAEQAGIQVGLGSDVGGGTSFSPLQTLNEAYKVLQLKAQNVSPLKMFYLATLGGARALSLDDCIGSFLPGREADFIVLNPRATPLLAHRMARANTLAERLFALAMLGDDRAIDAVYINGEQTALRATL